MNVFVPENAKVRVFVDQRGNSIAAQQNVIPSLQVEVVIVPDGKAMCTVDDELPGTLPFVSPVTRVQG